MSKINHASLEVALDWDSHDAHHRDCLFFDKTSFWRDFFPGDLDQQLRDGEVGEWQMVKDARSDLLEGWDKTLLIKAPKDKVTVEAKTVVPIVPTTGRFYPRTLFIGIPKNLREDIRSLRVVGEDENNLYFDFNHPLSQYTLNCSARIRDVLEGGQERGGRCNDIMMDIMVRGTGFQAIQNDGTATQFYQKDSLTSMDDRDDANTWQQDQDIPEIDSEAENNIHQVLNHVLKPGMNVLDLMAGSQSHLPDLADLRVTGLGLNQAELDRNAELNTRCIHDLNADTALPFDEDEFDAVICSFSVEYMRDPVAILKELARVAKAGAPVIMVFSDAFNPLKSIALWSELHPFERLGLVLDYFRQSNAFTALNSESFRDYPRPENDPHYENKLFSDPIFTAWATVK